VTTLVKVLDYLGQESAPKYSGSKVLS